MARRSCYDNHPSSPGQGNAAAKAEVRVSPQQGTVPARMPKDMATWSNCIYPCQDVQSQHAIGARRIHPWFVPGLESERGIR